MDDPKDHHREVWTARIAVRPAVRDAVARLAKDGLMPMALVIGHALDEYVTARSTT